MTRIFLLMVLHWVDIVLCQSQNVRFKIENSHLEPCAQVKNKQLIRNSTSNIDIQQSSLNLDKFGTAKITKLQFVDEKGEVKYLNVPGCYNVRVESVFTESISHPYIETYVKMETDELCKNAKVNPYCTPTENFAVRLITNNQITCKFCDMCVNADEFSSEAKQNSPNLAIRANNQICTENGQQIQAGFTYPFELTNICTPSSNELERQLQQKLGLNWRDSYRNYVKRGTIQFMIHILDRRNPAPKACLELGAGVYKWQGPASLSDRVKQSLVNTCKQYTGTLQAQDKPVDDYLSCYYGYVNYAIENL